MPTAIATKMSGLLVELNITLTSALNDSFSMLDCSNCKPMNRTPNPATICPKILSFLFLERSGIAPTNAKKAKNGVKLNADKETMNVVTVVPMLAPIRHAHACINVIVPKSDNLTRVTDVTSDD